jgi:hypothetical protein
MAAPRRLSVPNNIALLCGGPAIVWMALSREIIKKMGVASQQQNGRQKRLKILIII